MELRELLSVTPTGITITPVETESFTGTVATFTATDAGPFTASIDWGDGTNDTGTITANGSGGFDVGGTHTYAEDGSDPVSVAIVDAADSSTATAASTANVSEGAFVLNGVPQINTTEGVALTGIQVATFSDPGSPDPASDFAATIAWGDGTTDTGTLSGSGGNFTVTGNHTYTEEMTGSILVTVSEPAANFTIGPNPDFVTVADADSGTVTANAISATEGHAFSGQVAILADGYTGQVASDLAATINWGDGTTTAGTVTGSGGNFTISGSHAYADEGTFTVTTVVADDSPGTFTATGTATATVAEGDFGNLLPMTITPTEGQAFSGAVASFTDAGNPLQVAADFTASIDWGDGTKTSGTVAGPTGGPFTISGNHAYADEGTFTILASFADDAPSALNATISSRAVVADADSLVAGAASVSTTEGTTFSGTVATFTDTSYAENVPADFTAAINWGDGTTTAGVVSGDGGTFTVSGSHLYSDEGPNPLTVILADNLPGTASATATGVASVSDNDTLVAGTSVTGNSTEAATFTGTVATFTDTTYAGNLPADFSATIDWGDGTTTAGTISGSAGSFTVSGSHVYAEAGTKTATIVLSDDAPGTAMGTATAMIDVADQPLTATGTTVTSTEFTTFSGLVAAFTDTNPNGKVGDYTATIVWGDGTTTVGHISSDDGHFNVSGSHIFTEDGSYNVTARIADVGGSTATTSSTATVTELSITATAVAVSGFERSALTNVAVATFTHGNGAEPTGNFTATIDWGDGTSSSGVVTESGTTYTIAGTHTYLDESTYPVTVLLTDETASATLHTSATIKEELLPDGTQGTANERFISEVYRDLFHREVDAGGLAFWNSLLDQGQSRTQVVTAIIASSMPGELGTDLVTGIYEKLLDRTPDAQGLAFWVDLLNHGTTIEDVEANIAGTPEFFALAGGTNAGFITRLFNLALDRAPDAQALANFQADLANGITREQVAENVFKSHEYHQLEVAGYYQSPDDLNNVDDSSVPFIDDLDFLDRPTDPAGSAYSTAALDRGALDQDVWVVILASPEFFNKTA